MDEQLPTKKPSKVMALSDETLSRFRRHKIIPRESDNDCLNRILDKLESAPMFPQ